jgi:hypothetical protein
MTFWPGCAFCFWVFAIILITREVRCECRVVWLRQFRDMSFSSIFFVSSWRRRASFEPPRQFESLTFSGMRGSRTLVTVSVKGSRQSLRKQLFLSVTKNLFPFFVYVLGGNGVRFC